MQSFQHGPYIYFFEGEGEGGGGGGLAPPKNRFPDSSAISVLEMIKHEGNNYNILK